MVVSNFIVALTSPPDARYSPVIKPAKGPASPTSFDTVRALVLPIATGAVATKVTQNHITQSSVANIHAVIILLMLGFAHSSS